MAEASLDGQVAIVTGAGSNPGLGRSYAKLLASLGARVVVNDLGVGPDGKGNLPSRAEAVVGEILDAGGNAIASTESVASEDGARSIVATAVAAFGKVDILINNAGVVEFALFEELSASDIEMIFDTHVKGTLWMCRAVWPLMKAAGYGRIVNTASGSLLGARYASVYGAAKGAVLGLTRNLAIEGAENDIKVNAIWPTAATVAWTKMSAEEARPDEQTKSAFSPDLVAPTVGFLVQRECPVSGKFIGAGGDDIFEVFYSRTAGAVGQDWSPAKVAGAWREIIDRNAVREFGDPHDGGAGFTLRPRRYPS